MKPVFLDIETQRTDDPALIARLRDSVKPPGQYKKPESIAKWHAEEGAAARLEAVHGTALDGTYGCLATIGVAVGCGDPLILSGEEFDEVTMLNAFREYLRDEGVTHPYFVTHNGAAFDFRFLQQRAIINSVRIPRMPLGRSDEHYDTMLEWAGFRGYIKQTDLERALGFERSDPLSGGGSDVGEAIDAGDWASVVEHNTQDILGLRHIYRRMTA